MIEKSSVRRLGWAAVTGVAVVATALTLGGAAGLRAGGLGERTVAAQNAVAAMQHDKNALSRAGAVGRSAQDPTTATDRAASARYVAAERRLPDPKLTTAPIMRHRSAHPEDRYAMANGCYSLAGEPIFFKPTDLGDYLLYDADRKFVAAGGERADTPAAATVWTASRQSDGFVFHNDGGTLTIDGTSTFPLETTTGCAPYPESQIDVSGRPHAGVTPYQEVRGYVDGHTHGMAFEFLGGDAHCG